ncbi:ribonuclease P family protein [Actinidia rufa]|uniref:Ribonuclease P family protein n=1 Tax=Actinidia rufa TaxID=165716 RepID=A0A7J0F416_9ERIC|nr:ribonuclease P family protein [Actinidia rufa]
MAGGLQTSGGSASCVATETMDEGGGARCQGGRGRCGSSCSRRQSWRKGRILSLSLSTKGIHLPFPNPLSRIASLSKLAFRQLRGADPRIWETPVLRQASALPSLSTSITTDISLPLQGCILNDIHVAMTTDGSLQDQKKRTLDALQRRFALAESELRVQQQQNKKRPLEGNKRVTHSVNSSSPDVTDALSTLPSNVSSKKGNFSFSGYTTTQDVEANDSTYFQLCHPVNENLLPTSLKISDGRGSIVNQVIHKLLQSGDSAQKYMQGSRSMKIDNWILLDNLVQGRSASLGARIKALRTHSKRSKKHMSMKQQKKCGSLDLPQEFHKFDIFKPMHEMWKSYMTQLLKNVGKNQLAQCLLTADLHGAMILVVQCKIAAYTGVSGIMIRETAETFGIITQDNKFRVVPKKLSVFMFQADCWKITLHGDKLASRNIAS